MTGFALAGAIGAVLAGSWDGTQHQGRSPLRKRRTRSRLAIVGLLVLVPLLAVACGGSGDGDSPFVGGSSDDGGSSAAATPSNDDSSGDSGGSDDAATPESGEPSDSSLTDIDPDTALVVIGDERFEFDISSAFGDACITMFGVVAGIGDAKDGSDVRIDIEIPPVDYEGDPAYEGMFPNIEVRDDVNFRSFQAGGDFTYLEEPPAPEESQVVSFENDGVSATGTATFLDMQALSNHIFNDDPRPEPVQGTFEIRCS